MNIIDDVDASELCVSGEAADVLDDIYDVGSVAEFNIIVSNHFAGKTPSRQEVVKWIVDNHDKLVDECTIVQKAAPSKRKTNKKWYDVWFSVDGNEYCHMHQAQSKSELMKYYSDVHPNFKILKVRLSI